MHIRPVALRDHGYAPLVNSFGPPAGSKLACEYRPIINMTTKRAQRMLVSLAWCIFATIPAQAFYNPQTGHWLSRDPMEEQGGSNLYAFARNDGISASDPLGLASVRYEVVTGDPRGMTQLAGTWSQPWWAGGGSYFISPSGAEAMVTVGNAPSSWDRLFYVNGYCNTVWWGKDPAEPGEEPCVWGNAGAIRAYVTDDCGGSFRVSGMFVGTLHGGGPQPVYVRAFVYLSPGAPLHYEANRGNPNQIIIALIDEVVTLNPREEKRVADYEPFIRFNRAEYDGGRSSYGTAEGSITITSVTKVQ